MRISKIEKEKLREQILEKSILCLKSGGFQGMPVDKIMKDVGLTSGALYSHFDSKEDFFVQVVLKELDRRIALHAGEIEKEGPIAIEKFLHRYLSVEHVSNVEEGCSFVALGADMHRMKPSVRALFEEKIETLIATLAKGLRKGTREGKLDRMRFIYSSMVGTLTVARTLRSDEAIAKTLEATKSRLTELL